MKIFRLLLTPTLFFLLQVGFAQTSNLFADKFTELTTARDKMIIYLDSIDKYIYRDINLTTEALKECKLIVDTGVELGDSVLLEYAMAQIYFAYNKNNPVDAFHIIKDNEAIAKSEEISKKQIANFNYLKCFTLHSLGDLEAAQKEYYNGIEIGRLARDTGIMVRNLCSLGQLYNDENENEAAVSCFLQINDFAKQTNIRPSTLVLSNIELYEAYLKLEKYDKALDILDGAEKISEEHNLEILKIDILIGRGEVYLKQNKIKAAEAIYKLLKEANQGSQDENNLLNTQRFLGDLYMAKKMYTEALDITKDILKEADSTNLDFKIYCLEKAHEISSKMNDFEVAYDYLISYNNVVAEKTADEKRQKTAYLKAKYNIEQKEKDNAILSAELAKNQFERKLLFILIALGGLVLIVLFGAFYQKGRYNKRLEEEVQKRTNKLKESNEKLNQTNKELDEFNRILSHDLKEPLRNIVSFSQLANRDIDNPKKVRDYLGIVISSGEQLHQLIEDVNVFQQTSTCHSNDNSTVDILEILRDAVSHVQVNYPNKEVQLKTDTMPAVQGNLEILNVVFRNLIDNAVKYNEGEIALIHVRYELKNQNHCIEIEDNGIGIAPEYHDRVFKMFKRLNVRNAYTGSGLGLSIVKKSIEQIGGNISLLRSQQGVGSTFLLSFPASDKI